MIVYFADRYMNILGQASTELPDGLTITDDLKTEDIETGVAIFECRIPFDKKTRSQVESCTEVGNYILRSHDSENEFYTIIEAEIDTKNQEVYIYAEDAGLDLLNEVVGVYEADKAYPISHYIEKFAYDSGFVIGMNEASGLTRKLSWDGESTVTERLASVATQFDGCEISYSFDVKGLEITNKYINIHKKRGKDIGIQLRLNKEIDRIVTKKSIANLATALKCTGGTPEDAENPITLSGYKYDDGDFYVSGDKLLCRSALKKWSRYIWNKEPNKQSDFGHIVKTYEYDTLSQQTLCAHAITELKKISEIELNFEVDIGKLPDNIKIGDRVNIIDDAGELYLSTRLLMLEVSVADQTQKATLGEYLIKGSGISQKVADLAAEFAKLSVSSSRALMIANTAKTAATDAQAAADSAVQDAASAQTAAENATAAANTATQSAQEAKTAADNAQAAVDAVEEDVSGLQTSVANAQAAADQAKQAAETAQTKATEAQTAATNAQTKADEAATAASTAQTTANTAVNNAATAQSTAEQAITDAEAAATTAAAAKLDAEAAKADVDALGDDLTTLSNTMTADYARKTDLTETEASLQTQITQNAAGISSNASKIVTIDETANSAKETAESAQTAAAAAQSQADTAKSDAAAAQKAADDAAAAATAAQTEADNAKAAAATAQSVADKAESDLAAAKADLATVQSRVDATEEDIAAAQQAVDTAQAAADAAKADAAAAAAAATNAQTTADTAVTNAATAQTAADEAMSKANIAQAAADAAQGDATAAKTAADEAKANAATAKETAETAAANAATAQTKANEAATAAAAAQQAADDADAKAAAAQTDLDTAKQNLADVTSRVDATEEEVEAAQAAVVTAQAAADKAKADAATAQSTADTAKANAATAQTAADTAKAAADAAQADATAAQQAADAAQAAVDALAVRVTKTETDIVQTNEQIALMATKEEVTTTLGGYYTKEETDAAISVKADEINLSVRSTYTTKDDFNALEIGGRNLLNNSSFSENIDSWYYGNAEISSVDDVDCGHITGVLQETGYVYQSVVDKIDWSNLEQTYVFSADIRLDNFVKGTTNPHLALYFTGQYNNDGNIVYIGGTTVSGNPMIAPHAGNGWVRLYWVVKFTHEMDILNAYIYARDFEGDLYFKNLKLEKGNKATDWTPAPEDVNEGIDNAQDTAGNAQMSANELAAQVETMAAEIALLKDRIAMLVVGDGGETLFDQTEEGWTFNLKQVANNADTANQNIETLTGNLTNLSDDVSLVESAVNDLNRYTDYIHIGTENDQPLLELGEKDSDFKLKITNTNLRIMEGSDANTEASNEALRSNKTVVGAELQIGTDDATNGHWIWAIRENGNLGLQWKGAVE